MPRREVTLFIHWLEAYYSNDELATLTADIAGIKLRDRLALAYGSARSELANTMFFSPRADTGKHRHSLTKMGRYVGVKYPVYWYGGGQFYHSDPACPAIPGYFRAKEIYRKEFEVPTGIKNKDVIARKQEKLRQAGEKINKVGKLSSGQFMTPQGRKQGNKRPCPRCKPAA